MTLFGTIDNSTYDDELSNKVNTITAKMRELFEIPEPEIFTSEKMHYRMRAEFAIFHDGDSIHFTMTDKQGKERKRVFTDSFDPGTELMNFYMSILPNLLRPYEILRRGLFDIDFLTSLTSECLITFTYHKKLTEEWINTARELLEKLREGGRHVNIIGRALKQKIVLDEDFVWEELTLASGKKFKYQQVDNSFTQPNAHVAEKMLSWAQEVTLNSRGDLLELYCGNGNFSIALSQNFRNVLATEISKTSVRSAQLNIAANNVDNLKIVRLSAEEFTEALNGVREFRRLQESEVDLGSYECNTILVDPPRAGLDQGTLELVSHYDHIVYISCNPETLIENLKTLTETHDVVRLAFFDQFPYTPHIETGVFLSKKK